MSDVIIDFRDRLSALMVVSYSPFVFAFFFGRICLRLISRS